MDYPDEPTGNFGIRLAAARRSAGLTSKEAADRTGLRPSRISGIERGRVTPSLDDLRRIARALKFDLCYLMATRPGSDDAHAARHMRRRKRIPRLDPDD